MQEEFKAASVRNRCLVDQRRQQLSRWARHGVTRTSYDYGMERLLKDAMQEFRSRPWDTPALLHLHQLERKEDALVDAFCGRDHHTQQTHPSLASRVAAHIRRLTTSPPTVHFFDKDHFLPTQPALLLPRRCLFAAKMQNLDKVDCPHTGRKSPTLIFYDNRPQTAPIAPVMPMHRVEDALAALEVLHSPSRATLRPRRYRQRRCTFHWNQSPKKLLGMWTP